MKRQTKQTKKKDKKGKKEKLKMLPTLREKRHYLVLIVRGKTAVVKTVKEDIKTRINDAIINFIGILGYAKAGPLFIESGKTETSKTNKTSKQTKQTYFILSVTTKYVDAIKAAIALIKKPVIKCIGVSGTLKKSKRFFL